MNGLLIIFGILFLIWIFGSDKTQSHPSKKDNHSVSLAKHGIGKRRESRQIAEIESPIEFDLTEQKKEILELLEQTNCNIFLTGKAGTGKSNFLKYFRKNTNKNIAVLAYTGVAALNVQGQTIHSFFRLHPRDLNGSIKKVWGDGAKIYKNLQVIVIDEVSMVRALNTYSPYANSSV